MEVSRRYKLKVGEGILRQMVFTNLNICIAISIVINLVFIYFSRELANEIKIFGVAIISTCIVILLTYKFERQSLISLIPRAYKFYTSKKYDQY
ncbi:MAG: hypothetical protein WCK31_02885 [bacterium]